MRKCTSLVAALTLVATAFLFSDEVLARPDQFRVTIINKTKKTVTFEIKAGNCWEGKGTGKQNVKPGGRGYSFITARKQSGDCEGSQGGFGIQPANLPVSWFSFSNAGVLHQTNSPREYVNHLSDKSQSDDSYTWTYLGPPSD